MTTPCCCCCRLWISARTASEPAADTRPPYSHHLSVIFYVYKTIMTTPCCCCWRLWTSTSTLERWGVSWDAWDSGFIWNRRSNAALYYVSLYQVTRVAAIAPAFADTLLSVPITARFGNVIKVNQLMRSWIKSWKNEVTSTPAGFFVRISHAALLSYRRLWHEFDDMCPMGGWIGRLIQGVRFSGVNQSDRSDRSGIFKFWRSWMHLIQNEPFFTSISYFVQCCHASVACKKRLAPYLGFIKSCSDVLFLTRLRQRVLITISVFPTKLKTPNTYRIPQFS